MANELLIEGPISSAVEDVEGNTFDPADFDTETFLTQGFLDIDHLAHKYGIREAVVGVPVAVWRKGNQLWARFKLEATDLGREIHEYVKAHPGLLSFSVAGGLEKPLFARNGKWKLVSTAITHVPMQPDAAAFALSGNTMTLRGIMSAFAKDLEHQSVDTKSILSLYRYFSPMAGPVLGFELAAWADLRLHGQRAATDLMTEFRQALFYPEDTVESFALDTKAHLAEWKFLHPEDEHLDRSGRFNSMEDAVAHLRYCERLNPIQVATILGRIRGRGDIVRGFAA